MNSNQIREILTGTFTDAADRTYWEQRLAKAVRAESIAIDLNYTRLPNGEAA